MDEREKLEERLGHPRLREFTCNSLLRHSKNGMIVISTNLNISDANIKLCKEYESWLQNKKLEDSETSKNISKMLFIFSPLMKHPITMMKKVDKLI